MGVVWLVGHVKNNSKHFTTYVAQTSLYTEETVETLACREMNFRACTLVIFIIQIINQISRVKPDHVVKLFTYSAYRNNTVILVYTVVKQYRYRLVYGLCGLPDFSSEKSFHVVCCNSLSCLTGNDVVRRPETIILPRSRSQSESHDVDDKSRQHDGVTT